MAILYLILILFIVLGGSWLVTAGLVWLISLCFGFEFTFLLATGIWLVLQVLGWLFRRDVIVKK